MIGITKTETNLINKMTLQELRNLDKFANYKTTANFGGEIYHFKLK
jgi:hypothetical protein